MKRLRHLIRVLGWRRGILHRVSEFRRAIQPCYGGPFDGEWRYSLNMVVVAYVSVYPTVEGQPPIYSTGPGRHHRTIGMYHWTRRNRYEWTELTPTLVDEEAE